MDQAAAEESIEIQEKKGCINCGHSIIEEGYANKLCYNCRQKFIHFPIPVWIKVFGGAIAAIVLFAMFTLPKTFSSGIHQARGLEAENQKNYVTAQKEFAKVVEMHPSFIEGSGHLMIAAYYNQDFVTFAKILNTIQNKPIENTDLFSELDLLIRKTDDLFPSDSMNILLAKYGNNIDSIPNDEYKKYIQRFPNEPFVKDAFATKLLTTENYQYADSLATIVLENDPYYFPSLALKTSIKRELKEFDSSLFYAAKILAINHESSYGLGTKARTLLKQKKDTEGLALALKVYEMNKKDYYSVATLAMAYHLTNKVKERDALLKEAEKDSTSVQYMDYVKEVISGKKQFRD